MVKELEPFQRQVATPQQTVTSGNAFDQLGNAAGQIGALFADKINAEAIDKAAQQGALDAEKGELPDNLTLPLTKATKEYNQAGARIEAARMITSAAAQVQESFLNATNPATFSRQTPAQFHATLEGIIQGTLENTRDENRAIVSNALLDVSKKASLDMLKHSIKYDNDQLKFDAQKDLQGLSEGIRNATIAGDEQKVSTLTMLRDAALENYSVMSNEIKQQAPYIRDEFARQEVINSVLSEYAAADGDEAKTQFLKDFAANKQNMPFDEWEKAAKGVLELHTAENRLKADASAEDNALAVQGIKNGSITSPEQLQQFENLTPLQLINNQTLLDSQQQQARKAQQNIQDAQQKILRGESRNIPKQTLTAMFENTRLMFEQHTGNPMTLYDMAESLLGTNDYPFSGLPGTPLGTSIPEFNNLVQAELDSQDPVRVATGAQIVNNIVKTNKSPNSVNITGKAVTVSNLYNGLVLNGTITPEQAAESAIKTVYKTDEAELKERDRRFKKLSEKEVNAAFKQVTGVNPTGGKTDAAMGNFRDALHAQYMNSGDLDITTQGASYLMRSWGTSKWFDEGMVGSVVPEKELTITGVGYTFDNQMRSALQGVINRHENIKWAESEAPIDVANLTDTDKVFKPLGVRQLPAGMGATKTGAAMSTGVQPGQVKPKILIDGHESEVFLIPGPDARLGDRLTYTLGYYDRFGNPTPIPDSENSPSGVAQFSPVGLERWSPSIFESNMSDKIKEQALQFKFNQLESEVKQQQRNASLLERFLSPYDGANKETYIKWIETTTTGADEIEQLLRQRIQKDSPQSTRESLSKADNIGITTSKGGV